MTWLTAWNNLLKAHGYNTPCRQLCAVSQEGNSDQIHNIILYKDLNVSAFEWVEADFYHRTGFSCSVKQLKLRSLLHQMECNTEVETFTAVAVSTSVLLKMAH